MSSSKNNIIKLTESNFQKTVSFAVKQLIKPGCFMLAPTETVYGLMCLWHNEKARANIYKSKNRPENKPFQMLVNSIDMIKEAGGIISSTVERIVNSFCPGPITLIIPDKTGGKIGFRIPENQLILTIIEHSGSPLAATSANLSGDNPALKTDDAIDSLLFKPDLIIDAGPLPSNSIASTVVEIEGKKISILRPGPISLNEILPRGIDIWQKHFEDLN